jgi:hypothetical protein
MLFPCYKWKFVKSVILKFEKGLHGFKLLHTNIILIIIPDSSCSLFFGIRLVFGRLKTATFGDRVGAPIQAVLRRISKSDGIFVQRLKTMTVDKKSNLIIFKAQMLITYPRPI